MHILSELSQALSLLLDTSLLKKFLQDCTITDQRQSFLCWTYKIYLGGCLSLELWLSPVVLCMPGGL